MNTRWKLGDINFKYAKLQGLGNIGIYHVDNPSGADEALCISPMIAYKEALLPMVGMNEQRANMILRQESDLNKSNNAFSFLVLI